MKTLSELITEAVKLMDEIAVHPDYKQLIAKGYYPDLTLGDAQTALDYLISEVEAKE
ncbi:MAG: hypothetical protein V7K22_12970 [Nostoc sp.]|uniref:hypothetical protein n=1 Tax=Nostoc sp. TaxID=1180 RepID=UPI002FF957B8